jgi:aryl-alcohol dehydrogenase-like predicted oxidoreductase
LSEVGVDTIRRAHAVHPITDLQIEYAIISRMPERAIFALLRELGIGATAYGVLSRGLLAGSLPTSKGDLRAHLPRFRNDNLEQNRKLIDTLNTLAAARGVTPTQLAIAWVLARGEFIVPVIGARTRTQLEESLGALSINLSAADLEQIEQAMPPDAVAGTRYDENQMKVLDSERNA